VSFGVVVVVALVRFFRERDLARLEDADPVRIALGFAGIVAMLSAIRFLWLGLLPVLYLLRAARRADFAPQRVDAVAATVTLALALAFPAIGGLREAAVHLPGDLRGWLTRSHASQRFFDIGVRFLEETGVTGQVFHDYALGGYLCHRLAPGIRTFVDGSMNYPDDVARDYRGLIVARGAIEGEGFSEGLRRRGVDLFFGFGVPLGERAGYTTTALEGHPDWIRVSRSWRHGIYLRASPENAENLRRIADWYRDQGVAFDPELGFDPGRALREQRAWSDAWELLPVGWSDMLEAAVPVDGKVRVNALERLGLGYALVGAYPEQVASDRRAAALRPAAKPPRRRLVYGLLRLDRPLQALAQARQLVALDPEDPRSRTFARAVGEVSRATSPDARIAAINALPLLTSRQPLRE